MKLNNYNASSHFKFTDTSVYEMINKSAIYFSSKGLK